MMVGMLTPEIRDLITFEAELPEARATATATPSQPSP